MADPLSVAASIAGVIALVDLVFSRLVKYAKSPSNAATEAKAWVAEVVIILAYLLRWAMHGYFYESFPPIQCVTVEIFALSLALRLVPHRFCKGKS